MHCTHIHAPSGQPPSAPLGRSLARLWLPPSSFSFSRRLFPNAIPSVQKLFSSPGLNDLFFFLFSAQRGCLSTQLQPLRAPSKRSIFFIFKFVLAAEDLSFRQWGSFIAACRLSCCLVSANLAPQPGIKPASPPLQGGFLTNGSLKKSYIFYFLVRLTRSNIPKGSPPHPESGTVALIDAALIKQKELSRIPVLIIKPARPAPGCPLRSPRRPKLSCKTAPTLQSRVPSIATLTEARWSKPPPSGGPPLCACALGI